jgi:hypothetical protein
LDDFVECLDEAHRKVDPSADLKDWTDSWLKFKGPNTLAVRANGNGKFDIV